MSQGPLPGGYGPPPGHGYGYGGYPGPPRPPAPPAAPSWAIGMAVVAALGGVFVFLYLGMLGGRATAELVLGGLAVTLAGTIAATIGGIIALSRKRTGTGIAAIMIGGLGLLIGIGGVVLDAKFRGDKREGSAPTHYDAAPPGAPSPSQLETSRTSAVPSKETPSAGAEVASPSPSPSPAASAKNAAPRPPRRPAPPAGRAPTKPPSPVPGRGKDEL